MFIHSFNSGYLGYFYFFALVVNAAMHYAQIYLSPCFQFWGIYPKVEIIDYVRRPPTPGPQTGTSPWPVRNGAAQQEARSGPVRKASLTLLPELCLLKWQVSKCGKIVSHETSPWCQKG